MAFKAWSAFVDERDPIKVPCVDGGPEYVLPELPANVAHQYRLLAENPEADVPMRSWTADDERTNVLGEDLYLRMLEDGCPDVFIQRCVSVVIIDWNYGRDVAAAAYEQGVDPKALAALVAAKMRRAADLIGSPSTGEENDTPSPASSNGTTSRKTTKRAPGRPRKTKSDGPGSPTGGASSKPTG